MLPTDALLGSLVRLQLRQQRGSTGGPRGVIASFKAPAAAPRPPAASNELLAAEIRSLYPVRPLLPVSPRPTEPRSLFPRAAPSAQTAPRPMVPQPYAAPQHPRYPAPQQPAASILVHPAHSLVPARLIGSSPAGCSVSSRAIEASPAGAHGRRMRPQDKTSDEDYISGSISDSGADDQTESDEERVGKRAPGTRVSGDEEYGTKRTGAVRTRCSWTTGTRLLLAQTGNSKLSRICAE